MLFRRQRQIRPEVVRGPGQKHRRRRIPPWLPLAALVSVAAVVYVGAEFFPNNGGGSGNEIVRRASVIDSDLQGPARVIDGDTIKIAGQRVRLHGIDAPEWRQPCIKNGREWACGEAATDALKRMVGARLVTCEVLDLDRYGRLVARCTADGQDIGAAMVRQGWALAYRRYSHDYAGHEKTAKTSKIGVWGSEFVPPWDWRRGVRPAANENVAGKCLIKGNVSSKGERIYHVPGGQDYERTRISTAKGERWFCTEAEARAAGWRASKR